MADRPDLIAWGLGVAEAVSRRGECRRRRVGAIVLDRYGHIVGAGYNGAAPGAASCLDGACPRAFRSDVTPGTGYEATGCVVIHAEENALLDAGPRARHGTLIVNHEPCDHCRPRIVRARVARVAWPGGVWLPTIKESPLCRPDPST